MLKNCLLHSFNSSIKISNKSLISSSCHYSSLTIHPSKLPEMITSNNYDNCLLFNKSSDQSLTFVKLLLKILKSNFISSEAENKIHDLNQTFNHLISNGFNFNKVFPAHQLLSVLQKCQAALNQGNIDGTDKIDFSLAIKRLEPL